MGEIGHLVVAVAQAGDLAVAPLQVESLLVQRLKKSLDSNQNQHQQDMLVPPLEKNLWEQRSRRN